MAQTNLKRLFAAEGPKVGHAIFEFDTPGIGQIIATACPGQAHPHPVAGQGEGHEPQPPLEAGEAVAARPQALDDQFHLPAAAAARLSPHEIPFRPGRNLPEVAQGAAAE